MSTVILLLIWYKFFSVKQGEKTQASRSEHVHNMRTLQWIFDQADDDHGVSSHMYVPRGFGDDLYIQMEDLGAI